MWRETVWVIHWGLGVVHRVRLVVMCRGLWHVVKVWHTGDTGNPAIRGQLFQHGVGMSEPRWSMHGHLSGWPRLVHAQIPGGVPVHALMFHVLGGLGDVHGGQGLSS